jgi:holo-[acyl-carrier protein] synthase
MLSQKEHFKTLMLYTGVDIIEIARIQQAIDRWGDRFLQRVFTARELEDCQGRTPSLAARWAAKEAAAKALGSGLFGFGSSEMVGPQNAVRWHDLEVHRAVTGQPTLLLHGSAAERATALGCHAFALSLSHSNEYAVAFIVAEAS